MNRSSIRKRKNRLQFSQFENRIALAVDFAPSIGFDGLVETIFVASPQTELMDFGEGFSSPEALHQHATRPFEFDEAYLFSNQFEVVNSPTNYRFKSFPGDVLFRSASDLLGTTYREVGVEVGTELHSPATEVVFHHLDYFDAGGWGESSAISAAWDWNLGDLLGGGYVDNFSIQEYDSGFGEMLVDDFGVAHEPSFDQLMEDWRRSEVGSSQHAESSFVNFEPSRQAVDLNDLPQHDSKFEDISTSQTTNEARVLPVSQSHDDSVVSRDSVENGDQGSVEQGISKTFGQIDFEQSIKSQESGSQREVAPESEASFGDSNQVKDSFQAASANGVGSDLWLPTIDSDSRAEIMTPRIRELGNQILQNSIGGEQGTVNAVTNPKKMLFSEAATQVTPAESNPEDIRSSKGDLATIVTAHITANPVLLDVGMPIEPLLELASFDIFASMTDDSRVLNVEEASTSDSSLMWTVVVASAAGSIGWLMTKQKVNGTDKKRVGENQLSNAYDLTVRATVQWIG